MAGISGVAEEFGAYLKNRDLNDILNDIRDLGRDAYEAGEETLQRIKTLRAEGKYYEAAKLEGQAAYRIISSVIGVRSLIKGASRFLRKLDDLKAYFYKKRCRHASNIWFELDQLIFGRVAFAATPCGGDVGRAENGADSPYSGGPHRETSRPVGDGLDSHHCPARNCYQDAPISSADGPAIQMDPADHRLTSSYGNSADARAYRAEQQRLLNEGRVKEAIQMDIDDIRRVESEIGESGKYEAAIQKMRDYASGLNPSDFISP